MIIVNPREASQIYFLYFELIGEGSFLTHRVADIFNKNNTFEIEFEIADILKWAGFRYQEKLNLFETTCFFLRIKSYQDKWFATMLGEGRCLEDT